MKKFMILTCIIACVFGLTACSKEKPLTEYEQIKCEAAVEKAQQDVIPGIQALIESGKKEELKEFTSEELETVVKNYYGGYSVNGKTYLNTVESFEKTYEEIGGYGTITGAEAKIAGKKIVVNITVEGGTKSATAEIIFSNDAFLDLQSASLNMESSISDSMEKAALNTLLGMGTVFAVLILISLIISSFGLISKAQKSMEKSKAEKKTSEKAMDKVVANIAKQEETEALTDDLELVAVIAAAIAASEGASSTDGFVVRSINRRKAR